MSLPSYLDLGKKIQSWNAHLRPISLMIFFYHNSYLVENLCNCNSSTGHQITTKFCTCHDSCAVVSCGKFCSDRFVWIWMRAIWNFHGIWCQKLLVGHAPSWFLSVSCVMPSSHQDVLSPIPSWQLSLPSLLISVMSGMLAVFVAILAAHTDSPQHTALQQPGPPGGGSEHRPPGSQVWAYLCYHDNHQTTAGTHCCRTGGPTCQGVGVTQGVTPTPIPTLGHGRSLSGADTDVPG